MDKQMFQKYGHQLIDWAVQYMEGLPQRNPVTNEKPGFMTRFVPSEPPQNGEPFESILKDLEPVVCHGMAHWQHRQFFAYFPAGNSWPSILGNLFSNATGANGSTWHTCPAMTELEVIVMDWICKFLGLPDFFLSSYSNPLSEGQGIVQCSASDAIFYSIIWARQDALRKLRKKYPDKPKGTLLNMLVAYYNKECHSSVEKGASIACVRARALVADETGVIRKHVLKNAIKQDLRDGLVPFFHCAIIGSTGITCSDDLMEVGPLCQKYDMWLHVDAAYAGSSFVLPELNFLKQGYEYVWSTNINTNKWMMCNFEATLHWVRYRNKAVDAFAGDVKSVIKYPNGLGPDLRHYGVAASRRFRAFKLWCVIRTYGVEGIRRYIRNHINLARLFETYVRRDPRFEVVGGPFRYGLVTFRLKGYNVLTRLLVDALNASHKIHMVPSHFHDYFVIRFALCHEFANERDIDRAWRTIDEFATVIIQDFEAKNHEDEIMKDTYDKQHRLQELRAEFPDPEWDKEMAEAVEIVKHKEIMDNDKLVQGADTAAIDGSFDTMDESTMLKYDSYLKTHPPPHKDHDKEEEEAGIFLGPKPSMLHFKSLKATISHGPDKSSV